MSSLQPAEDLRAYGLLTLGLFNMNNCILYENMDYVARNKEIMTNYSKLAKYCTVWIFEIYNSYQHNKILLMMIMFLIKHPF